LNVEVELLNVRAALVRIFGPAINEGRQFRRIQQTLRITIYKPERRGCGNCRWSEDRRN